MDSSSIHQLELLHDALMYFEEAKCLQNRDGDYRKGIETLQHSLRIRESILGLYHEDTAMVYYQMAWANYLAKDYKSAVSLFQRCLKVSQYLYGNDNGATWIILDDLQDVLLDAKGSATHIGTMCQALSDCWTLSQEGDDYLKQGQIEKSVVEYEAALACFAQNAGDIQISSSLDVADLYCKIAPLIQNEGEINRAVSLICMAVGTYERLLGREHPTTRAARKQATTLSQQCKVDQMSERRVCDTPKTRSKKWFVRGPQSSLKGKNEARILEIACE